MAELDHTFTTNAAGGATLHVSQAPPNAAIMQPGPAWFFVVVNGVPSVGVRVMIGSGKIEEQQILAAESLPESSTVTATADASPNHSGAYHASPLFSLFATIVVATSAWLFPLL
ncbi:hypothetical protein FRC18_008971 [Serendipita sp. 400]|nr:hypothetical protein FRC18_008971 [Serendipita sp. 400]